MFPFCLIILFESMHPVYYQVFGCNPISSISVSCNMVQHPLDQAVQSAPIGAANSGLMNDTTDVDADIADPAAAVADAVADAAEDPPPPPPPAADDYVPITPFCSMPCAIDQQDQPERAIVPRVSQHACNIVHQAIHLLVASSNIDQVPCSGVLLLHNGHGPQGIR